MKLLLTYDFMKLLKNVSSCSFNWSTNTWNSHVVFRVNNCATINVPSGFTALPNKSGNFVHEHNRRSNHLTGHEK